MKESHRNCACLIHGDVYPWDYVDKLYSMLNRHSSQPIRLHVLTEPSRAVPDHMIKVNLDIWENISGPRLSWWYKMQLFDVHKISVPVVYFDLDIVLVDSIDWIWDLDKKFFWTIKDFQHLWKKDTDHMNSSIMSWDPDRYYWIWEDFSRLDRGQIIKKYRGDQDYLDRILPRSHLGFFDVSWVRSWKWEVSDGGWDFRIKKPKSPGNTIIPKDTKILVFHGDPKPHKIKSSAIRNHWI